MHSTNMNIRVDNKIKNQAKELFAQLGMDMTTAINIFLRQAIQEHGIPFDVKIRIPNYETRKAMEDAENNIGMSKTFDTPDEMFNDLGI